MTLLPARRSRIPCSLALLTALAASHPARIAHADPPAMREEAADPSIEFITDDGEHRLAVGGFVQLRGQRFFPRAAEDFPSIGLPRTRFYVFGHVRPEIRYRLMIGTLPYQENVRIFDAYAEWAPSPIFRLRGGRFKIPVLRGWIESGRELATIERAPAVLATLPGRAVGVLAGARAFGERIDVSVGVFERRGDPALPEGIGSRAVAARLLWNVQGRPIEGELDLQSSPFTIAVGSSATRSFGAINQDERGEWLAAVDLAGRYRGFDAIAEVGMRGRDRPGLERTIIAHARADYYFLPLRTAFGVRTSHLVGIDQNQLDQHEIELDVTWLPYGHDVKAIGAVLLRQLRSQEWHPGVAAQVQVAF